MKRTSTILLAGVLGTGLGAAPAMAQSPHFIGTPTCTKSLSTGLTCSGKAAGLGNSPTNAFLTASEIDAQYACFNKGGNFAPGHPVFFGPTTGNTQQITPRNGQITFSPTIPVPPTPSAREVCPNGNWTVHLVSLSYKGVVLHITQDSTDLLMFNFGTIDP